MGNIVVLHRQHDGVLVRGHLKVPLLDEPLLLILQAIKALRNHLGCMTDENELDENEQPNIHPSIKNFEQYQHNSGYSEGSTGIDFTLTEKGLMTSEKEELDEQTSKVNSENPSDDDLKIDAASMSAKMHDDTIVSSGCLDVLRKATSARDVFASGLKIISNWWQRKGEELRYKLGRDIVYIQVYRKVHLFHRLDTFN